MGIWLPKADDAFGNAKNFGQERDRVSSQIQEGATSQFRIKDAVIAGKVFAIVRINRLDLTNGFGFQELAKHIKFWKVESPKRFGQKQLLPASQFRHFEG